jgi:hypothetical protein
MKMMSYNKQFLHPKSQAGQAIVLLALMMIVLLGAVGFAVDGGQAYYYSTRIEIAAGSAAMAGVVYMPNQFAPVASKNDATDAALATAYLNGFQNGVNGVTVTSAPVAGFPNRLAVTVKKSFPTFFMKIFGVNSISVSRTAVAVYAPPLSLGQSGTQMGTVTSQLGSGGSNYYFMRTEGWSTDRQQGDAFTPDPSSAHSGYGSSNDIHVINGTSGSDTGAGVAGLPTRGGYNYLITLPVGGYIQVYNAINGPDDGSNNNGDGNNGNGGYNNCENHITASNGNGKLDQCNTHGSSYYLHEEDGINFGNATTYSTMEYSVLSVANTFIHSSDTLISQVKVFPIDASPQDGASGYDGKVTGCGNACAIKKAYTNVGTGGLIDQTYDNSGNPTNMQTYHAWVDITGATYSGAADGGTFQRIGSVPSNGPLPAGTYRLRVDTLSSDGNNSSQAHKAYDVRVVDAAGLAGGTNSCSNCTINAWNDMAIYTPVSSSAGGFFDMQAVQIPADYAGSTVTFDIFDIGDMGGSGNIDVSLIGPCATPPCSPYTVTAPLAIQVFDDGISRVPVGTPGACPAGGGVQNPTSSTPCLIQNGQTATTRVTTGGFGTYNGHWIRFVVPIDAGYAPGANAWWSIRYQTSNQVTADDTVTFAVGLKGNPVHLKSST